jgi:hypothetical protein
VFIADKLCNMGEVVVRAIFPFPYMNLFNRGVTSSAVCVSDESRFKESDEVGYSSLRAGVSATMGVNLQVR